MQTNDISSEEHCCKLHTQIIQQVFDNIFIALAASQTSSIAQQMVEPTDVPHNCSI